MKKIVVACSAAAMLMVVFAGGRCFSAYYAFVPNSGDGTVSIINTMNNEEVAVCNVGTGPYGVAVSPDGKHVYVTNTESGTLSIIDPFVDYSASPDEPVSISVGDRPYGVAVSPDSGYVYVTNNIDEGAVTVIDTTTDPFTVDEYAILVGAAPAGIAISPDGNYAYVANTDDLFNPVSVISTSDHAVASIDIDTADEGYQPYGVAVSPTGSYVYITNSGKNNVTVISTSDNTFSDINDASFNTPRGIAVSPDGVYVYVANSGGTKVSKIDTTDPGDYAVTEIDGAFNAPYGLTVSPDGDFVYVVNNGDGGSGVGTVSVIDTEDDTVSADTIDIGVNPIGLGRFIVNVVFVAAPTNLQATVVSEDQIDLSWSHTPFYGNQPWFQIEREISYGFYSIATVKPGITTYCDTGLRPGSTYSYRVRAYDSEGYSAYSNESEAKIPSDDACFISTAFFGIIY